MPTREQIERSRKRNRERGYADEYFKRCAERAAEEEEKRAARDRMEREAAAGPRFRNGKDMWGGPEPPAA